jgi:signal peptidase I
MEKVENNVEDIKIDNSEETEQPVEVEATEEIEEIEATEEAETTEEDAEENKEQPEEVEQSTEEVKKSNKILDFLKETAKTLLWACLTAYIIGNLVILNAVIPSGSMLDTIPLKARIIATRYYDEFQSINRGEIIIFKYPDDESMIFIKRVIGLPGDTIEGKDGEIYINGEILEETYIKDKINEDFGPYTVPDGCYFMMGDNRLNSKDSRYWDNKFVTEDEILGKAKLMYYPTFKKLN